MGFQPGVTETGRADVGGGRLSFEVRGTGRDVVLVHGGLLGRRVWDPVMAPLARRYRVRRLDHRGYGDSDRPNGVYAYWEDLLRLADHWTMPKAVYVGLGEGAAAALDLALAAPERVEALVLLSPYLHGYDYSPAFQIQLRRLADAYVTTGATAVADALLKDDHYPPAAGQEETRKRLRALVMENAHVLAFNWMHVRPLEPLAAGRLGEVAMPALILSGGRDSIDNRNVADRLRFGIPKAAHAVIPAGHVLPLEAPGAVVEAVARFLDETRPG